jgi:hypothetical protein
MLRRFRLNPPQTMHSTASVLSTHQDTFGVQLPAENIYRFRLQHRQFLLTAWFPFACCDDIVPSLERMVAFPGWKGRNALPRGHMISITFFKM